MPSKDYVPGKDAGFHAMQEAIYARVALHAAEWLPAASRRGSIYLALPITREGAPITRERRILCDSQRTYRLGMGVFYAGICGLPALRIHLLSLTQDAPPGRVGRAGGTGNPPPSPTLSL